jgi:hypothetical protein
LLNVSGEVDGVRMVELLVPNQVGQSFVPFFQLNNVLKDKMFLQRLYNNESNKKLPYFIRVPLFVASFGSLSL